MKNTLSKLEWLGIVGVIICLFALLIPPTLSIPKKLKAKEAPTNLIKIYDAQINFFKQHASFVSLPVTPSTPTKSKQLAKFQQEPWSALELDINPSVYYSYEVKTQTIGSQYLFEAIAKGDLDGDGITSTYVIKGFFNPNGQPMGRDLIYQLDPLE